MTRSLIVTIGGPAYTGVTRIEHTCHVANVVAEMHRNGVDVRMRYWPSSLVGDARAELLTRAIDDGSDVFLSIDSDTWGPLGEDAIFKGAFTLCAMASLWPNEKAVAKQYWDEKEISAFPDELGRKLAIVSLAVATKDRQLNVWGRDRRMTVDDWQNPITRVSATGLAYAMFNIRWYREHRAVSRRFDCWVDGESEDVSHCKAVTAAGGHILAGFTKTLHKPWGSDEILILDPGYSAQP